MICPRTRALWKPGVRFEAGRLYCPLCGRDAP